MQNAPSVSYPVGRSSLEALALLALSTVGGGAIVWAWWVDRLTVSAPSFWAPWLLGLGVWMAWTIAAAGHWWRQPAGALKWDAQAAPDRLDGQPGVWFWLPQLGDLKPVAVQPEQVFDWQGWVLLRLRRSKRAAMWVWLERRGDPTHWDDVRRALAQTR
jgi:hypothetical protein